MISTFSELLTAAIEQDEPQRLLFLFAKTQTEDSSQNNDQHGTLTPIMCVDKLPEDIESFKTLAIEADNISSDWDFMITVGLAGKNGMPPSEEEAEPFLNQMANDLTTGQSMSKYLIFDRDENQILIEVC